MLIYVTHRTANAFAEDLDSKITTVKKRACLAVYVAAVSTHIRLA